MRGRTLIYIILVTLGFVLISPSGYGILFVIGLLASPFLAVHFLPTIILYGTLAWLIARLLRETTLPRFARLCSALALALLPGALAASWINATITRQAAALVEHDRFPALERFPDRIALWLPADKDYEPGCTAICVELLTKTNVRAVLIVTDPLSDLPPAQDAKATAWQLETRPDCPRDDLLTDDQSFRDAGTEGLDLTAAMGRCVVETDARLSQADGLITHTVIAGADAPLKSPLIGGNGMSARRISSFTRDGATWTEVQRRTYVRWLRHPWIMMPVLGYGDPVVVWQTRFSAPSFSSSTKSVKLKDWDLPPVPEEKLSDLAPRVDVILATQGWLTKGEATLAALYLRRLANTHLPHNKPAIALAEADRARVIGIVGDKRLPLVPQTGDLIELTFPLSAETADHLASTSVNRMTRLLAVETLGDIYVVSDQIKATAHLIAALPLQSLVPWQSEIEGFLSHHRFFYNSGIITAAFAASGPSAVPKLLSILLTDSNISTNTYRRYGALRGLCLLGPDAAPALPDLRAALTAKKLHPGSFDNDLMLHTLIRLGASDDDLAAMRLDFHPYSTDPAKWASFVAETRANPRCPL